MADKDIKLSKVLSESELCLIEDALKDFSPRYLNDDHGRKLLAGLKETVTSARRWAHQFGKTERK